MKSTLIFRTRRSFTWHFMGFLDDHRCLRYFLHHCAFGSIEDYCSYFYEAVCDGHLDFDDAIVGAFLFDAEDFDYLSRISKEWKKFIHSK